MAFLAPAPIQASSLTHASGRTQLPRRRTRVHTAPPQHAALHTRRIQPFCSTDKGAHGEGNDEDTKSNRDTTAALQSGPSGTIFGRVLVETLALFTGVVLLVLVAFWKALSVLGIYAWRGLLWLSVVRRLGHWVFGRMYSLGKLSISQPRRLVELAITSLKSTWASVREWTRNGPPAPHVNVRAERVVEQDPGVTDEVKHMRKELVNLREAIERREKANGNGNGNTDESTQTSEEVQQPPPPPTRNPPRLILLRHAKSEWDRTGATADHERALSQAGVDEARRIGAELVRRGWHFDSVLCSNARRTTETLACLSRVDSNTSNASDAQEFQHQVTSPTAEVTPVVTENLYFALSGEEMATVVDGEAQPGDCKLIVAHAPGISELVERLSGVKPDMGTACAALLELGCEDSSARDLYSANGQWTLVDVVCPGRLERV